jgi:nucleotide-binding universal stress UspA family protein
MAIKSILVPVEDGAGLQAQLATALLVAASSGAHIDGAAPRAVFGAYVFSDGMSAATTTALESFEQDETARVERMQAAFREFMREPDVAWGDPLKPSTRPTADWLHEIAPGDEAIGQLARLYDLTVLARPLSDAPVPRAALLETVLFEGGRPILVAPPEAPASLGEVVLVAWNGSTESARAITFAQPFLGRAKRVVVLAVEGGSVPGPNVGEVERALCRAGIAAEASGVRPEGRPVGEVILAEAAKMGADLLVKGAYTHSRLRQMIFGGATSHILSEAKLPVLLAH